MRKLLLCLALTLIGFQAQAQTVIRQCANGSTVGGNSSCSSSGSGSYTPPTYWGAVSYAPQDGRFFYTTGYKRESSASSAANRACRKAKTGGECLPVFTAHDQCYALARGDQYYSINYGKSQALAERRALRYCQGFDNHVCEVTLSKCLN